MPVVPGPAITPVGLTTVPLVKIPEALVAVVTLAVAPAVDVGVKVNVMPLFVVMLPAFAVTIPARVVATAMIRKRLRRLFGIMAGGG